MPKYFLAKTDPQTYSLDDLEREGKTCWDGVHNRQAINVIKQWEVGDFVLIYHSQGQAKIVGLARVVSEPRENLDDPRYSWVADLEFVRRFDENQQISLQEMKQSGLFADFALIKQSRLSTMACPPDFIDWLKSLGLLLAD